MNKSKIMLGILLLLSSNYGSPKTQSHHSGKLTTHHTIGSPSNHQPQGNTQQAQRPMTGLAIASTTMPINTGKITYSNSVPVINNANTPNANINQYQQQPQQQPNPLLVQNQTQIPNSIDTINNTLLGNRLEKEKNKITELKKRAENNKQAINAKLKLLNKPPLR